MIRHLASPAVALWLVLSFWAVGIAEYIFDFLAEYVWAVFIIGGGAALLEWRQTRSKRD